jgi:drug/metabolite transporter (DMT)-like permease
MRAAWRRMFIFWQKYEHHLGVGAIATGFAFDLFLAKRPDSVIDNALLLTYLFVAGAFIIILNLREVRRKENMSVEPLFLLLILQFCFGGLASNLLVLYGHSGTIGGSVLFLGLLLALVFGNEYLRSRYVRLRFNIAVYYFLLLTYCIIAVPTFIFHSLGTWVFVGSGLISLAVMAGFLFVLYTAVLRKTARGLSDALMIVGAIFCLFSGLYFLDIIPPVPLSLKNIGVYHSVLKQSGGGYFATYEAAQWYVFWRDTSATYTINAQDGGNVASCFSSVFAPTDLNTAIYHRWEEYDSEAGRWQTMSRISFPISGGRAAGYEGYTIKSVTPGEWRCDVESQSGALIGRVSFTVVAASTTPQLSQTTL